MAKEPPRGHFIALHEIRDRAYMLSLGNVYLCEDVFLKKIGNQIDSMIGSLKGDIAFLKKRYPGKFASDVDTNTVLEELRSKVEELKNPDAGMNDKCTTGELGLELEQTLKTLTGAIKALTAKVEGELPEYTKKDALIDVLGKAKTPTSAVTSAVALVLKGVILLLLLAIGPFVYLFVTMDREGTLLKAIGESEAQIQSARESLISLERERVEISQKIEALRREDSVRQDKITIMDLNLQAHGLDEKRSKAEVEIGNLEEKIKENRAKIANIKGKPFVQRLLKK